MKAWRKAGYTVVRTAGSHGPWDIVAVRSDRPSECIQCKRVENEAIALRLIKEFKANPLLNPSGYFHQVIEVYCSATREVLRGTV